MTQKLAVMVTKIPMSKFKEKSLNKINLENVTVENYLFIVIHYLI